MTDAPQDLRTIKATNERLRSLMETQAVVRDKFWIGGVVKDVNAKSYAGHLYFTLDDSGYSISCMLPKRHNDKAIFVKRGEVLDVYGIVKVYDKTAEFQIHIEDIRLAQRKLLDYDPSVWQQLKEKGLWPRSKKDLPIPPRQIALITSDTSAGYSDFVATYKNENGKGNITVFNVPLETIDAPSEIAKAIRSINQAQKADLIAIVRGGGNLSSFNDIRVAEAMCLSEIPIITGIGHQTNLTVADRVADESTYTPTATAYKLAKLEPVGQKVSGAAVQSQFIETPKIQKNVSTNPISKNKESDNNLFQTNAIGIIGIIVGILILAALIFLIFQSL